MYRTSRIYRNLICALVNPAFTLKSFLFVCCLLPLFLFAQSELKIERLSFCGWNYNSKKRIREHFGEQYAFLSPQKGDTIVDIGAASGTYEGCLAAGYDLEGVSFVLVDIDKRCLNEQKVANMLRHYSTVKGDSIRNAFQLVVNTPDSLFLPLDRYKKVWLLNTLHEVSSPEKMAGDVAAILQSGGEVSILEIIPEHPGQLHGGCNQPLLTTEAINSLFSNHGFRVGDKKTLYQKGKATIMLHRFLKN